MDRLEAGKATDIVRFKQDTGISSPSLYPSLPLPLVFSAVDPVGTSTAKASRAAVAGKEFNTREGDMFAIGPCSEVVAPRWVGGRETGAEKTRRCFCRGLRSLRTWPAIGVAINLRRQGMDSSSKNYDGSGRLSLDSYMRIEIRMLHAVLDHDRHYCFEKCPNYIFWISRYALSYVGENRSTPSLDKDSIKAINRGID